jgi:large subunit ribosomal protein L17
MHRHGYKGRKFGRETDQRRALIKGLAESLVRDESIKTTLPKAKELVPYIEKLITKAKKGDLHSRRQVISGLQTIESAHKLVDDLAPKMGGRTSGHVRIEKLENRRGDNALIAKVTFVDDLKEAPIAKPVKKAEAKAEVKPVVAKKAVTKKPAVKKAATAKETK